jgi:hypothetical protein
MGIFAITDPALLAGQKEGYQVLEANTGTQTQNNVGRLMDRYGTANADYMAKMMQAQKGAEAMAKLRLDARLQDAQFRARIHDHKLQMLRKQYKAQERAQRGAMYAQLIGAASSMAPGVYGMMTTPSVSPDMMSYTPQAEIFNQPTPYWYNPQPVMNA